MEENILKELAQQLSNPSGSKGLEMANIMHLSNINMTIHAIEQLQLKEEEDVLELGHGGGAHIPTLISTYKINYTGLDISEDMVNLAKANNQSWINLKKADFSHYDGIKLPFNGVLFDKIFTVNTIYFWQDVEELLSQLYTATAEGGKLCITIAHKSFMQTLPFTKFGFTLYQPEQVCTLLTNAGFTNITIATSKDNVVSKSGENVQRNFSSITGTKH